MTTITRLALFAFLCLFSTGVAFSQSQAEMNEEARQGFETADKALNATYKKLLATQDEESVALLKKAQVAWLQFRDADAKFTADAEARGGSLYPLIFSGRLATLTQQRTAQLEELLQLNADR